MSEWLPIESAPRDGTWFLGGWWFQGRWVYRMGRIWRGKHQEAPYYHNVHFDAWQPLPEPPRDGAMRGEPVFVTTVGNI